MSELLFRGMESRIRSSWMTGNYARFQEWVRWMQEMTDAGYVLSESFIKERMHVSRAYCNMKFHDELRYIKRYTEDEMTGILTEEPPERLGVTKVYYHTGDFMNWLRRNVVASRQIIRVDIRPLLEQEEIESYTRMRSGQDREWFYRRLCRSALNNLGIAVRGTAYDSIKKTDRNNSDVDAVSVDFNRILERYDAVEFLDAIIVANSPETRENYATSEQLYREMFAAGAIKLIVGTVNENKGSKTMFLLPEEPMDDDAIVAPVPYSGWVRWREHVPEFRQGIPR